MKPLSTPSFVLQVCCTLLLLSWMSCRPDKGDPTIKAPSLGTVMMSEIKTTSAKATCPLKEIGFGVSGNSTITEYGICYGLKESPTITDTKISVGTTVTATLDIVANLTGLAQGTKYYVRGYATYDGNTAYSDQVQFTTDNLKAPEVTTADAADLTTTAFSITGKLTSLGTSDITQYGHVLSETNQTPTTADTKTEMGGSNSVPKDFKSTFGSLKANTTYYVRAYATNATGTGYSEVKTVKTSNQIPPAVTTGDATDLTASNFNISGRVTSIGTLDVTQFGHCLSETNQTPTPADTKTEMGGTNAPKDFKSTFGSLKTNTTYYVRAYAISPAGTAYSDVKTIKTTNVQPPTVTTQGVDQVTINAARATGTISSAGTSPVTQYGHFWSSTSNDPKENDAKTQLGSTSAPKDFASSLTNLTPGTTYYVRAYATSSTGTSYGDVKTFKTADAQLPVVTAPASGSESVGATTMAVYGKVTSLGSTGSVTQYGHCYSSTNQTPTINDTKTAKGSLSALNDFISNIDGLTPNTTYYVRAYATSSVGTAYSEVRVIKTQDLTPPVVGAVNLASQKQCGGTFATGAFYNDPCSLTTVKYMDRITVSFSFQTKTESIAFAGICVNSDASSGTPEPTVNDGKVQASFSTITSNSYAVSFNDLYETRTKKTVQCGTCPSPLPTPYLGICGAQTAKEFAFRNPYIVPYTVYLLGGGTRKSIAYRYRAYLITTGGKVYYGPTTVIDAANSTTECTFIIK